MYCWICFVSGGIIYVCRVYSEVRMTSRRVSTCRTTKYEGIHMDSMKENAFGVCPSAGTRLLLVLSGSPRGRLPDGRLIVAFDWSKWIKTSGTCVLSSPVKSDMNIETWPAASTVKICTDFIHQHSTLRSVKHLDSNSEEHRKVP